MGHGEKQTAEQKALQSAKAAHHRLDRLERDVQDIHALAQAMAATQREVAEYQKEDLCDVQKNISQLAAQPGSHWEHLINVLISAVSVGFINTILLWIFR